MHNRQNLARPDQACGGGDVTGAEGNAPGRWAPGEILLHLTAFPFPHLWPPHCSALHGPNAWLSVPVRGLGPGEGRGSDMLLFKDGYMNVSYTRKRSSKDCLMCVMYTGYLILQVLLNHLRQRLLWAVFASGSDTSLEECLSLASRVFVVWWRSWEDEEICQLSCDSDWEQLNKNKSCFNEAELTKLIIGV